MTTVPATQTQSEAVPAPPITANDAMVAIVRQRIEATGKYVGTSAFLAQALGANTLDEATATGDLVSSDAIIGERLRFDGVTFCDSDLDGKLPFYAIVDVVRSSTGETCKMSCGGERVVATLLRAQECGWFPFDATIESVGLAGGKSALNLVPAPKQV